VEILIDHHVRQEQSAPALQEVKACPTSACLFRFLRGDVYHIVRSVGKPPPDDRRRQVDSYWISGTGESPFPDPAYISLHERTMQGIMLLRAFVIASLL
jgi:hypothetical protein